MESLPNELLLEIASYLPDGADLSALCLVNRSFGACAQEVLHRSPCIPPPNMRASRCPESRIAKLLRTLTQRPDLAGHVKRLELSAVVRLVRIDSTLLRPSAQHAVGQTREIGECRLAGMILGQVPSLQELAIEILHLNGELQFYDMDYMHRHDSMRYASVSFHEFFGLSPTIADISFVVGLRNLKKLEFFGLELQEAWYLLPQLEELSIGRACTPRVALPGESNVRTLRIELETATLQYLRRNLQSPMPAFLARFTRLTVLQIYLTDRLYSTYTDGSTTSNSTLSSYRNASFQDLVSCLSSVEETLQILELVVPPEETPRFLRFIVSFQTLAQFTSLRVLKVPQESLLASWWDGPLRAQRQPVGILPSTLEMLTLVHPYTNSLGWIGEIVKNRNHFSNLRQINVTPHPEADERVWYADPLWSRLEQMGIVVQWSS